MRLSIRSFVLAVLTAALIAALLPLPVVRAATVGPVTSSLARQFEQPIVIVNTGFLHLRSGPGGFYAVIGTLPGGSVLPVVGRNRDDSWWQVQSVFGVGWVSGEFVIPRGDFTLVPIVNDLGLREQARALVPGNPVNVYTYPDRGAFLLGLALGGSELPIAGRTADGVWWQVRTNVGSGWVLQQDVVLRGSATAVPVVTAPVAQVQPVVLLPPVTTTIPDGQGGAEPPTTTTTTTTTGGATTTTNVRHVAVVLSDGGELKERPDINSATIDYVSPNERFDIVRYSPRGDFVEVSYRENFSFRSGWISVATIGIVVLDDPRLQAIYTGPNVLLDLKAAPDENSETVAVVPRGAQIAVNNSLPGGVWLQVQYGTDIGWVSGFSVVIVGSGPATTTTAQTTPLVGSPASGLYAGGVALVPVPQPEPARNYVIVNTSFLNVRSGPGANYTTLQTVSGATEFDVTGITPDSVWFRVVGPFGTGWVNSEFVIFRGTIGDVPVVQYGEATGLTTVSLPQAIANSPVNVYLGPGVNTGLLGTASAGASLPVVGRTADWVWLQVQTQVGFGWVLYSTITFRGEAGLVPIVG